MYWIAGLLASAVVALFVLWNKARDGCDERDRVSAGLLSEQKVLNERALAQIQFREFERDSARKEVERCDRDLERCRYPSQTPTPSLTS